MKDFIFKSLLKPAVRRIGTALAALLVSQGVPEETVMQIITGVSALALVGADLVLAALHERKS